MPQAVLARCVNVTTGVVLGNSTGQPLSNQSVVCDATSTTSTVVSGGANSSNVSVTVLPGAIISPGVRAIGVVNNSTVLNQGEIRTGANNSFGITSTGNASTLTNSGTIATTGPNGYGLDARGSNSTLINNGTITTSGTDSAGVRSTETTAATLIENSGTINVTGPSSTQYNGAGIVFQTGAAGTFINTASGSVTSAGDAGVRGANGNINVQNAGNLTGGNGDAIILGNGNNTIQITAGYLTGSVLSGSGNNHFTMSGGTVFGDVVFGGGSNVFSLTGGTIAGGITSGAGNDTFSLSTGATVSGAINGGAGTNALTLDGSGTGSYGGALSNIQTLTKQNTGSWTLSGSLAGVSSLVVNGGTLALAGGSGLTATTMLSAGTLQVASSTALGSGALAWNGGTLQTAANNLTFSNATSITTPGGQVYGAILDTLGNALTLGGTFSGSGALDIADSTAAAGTTGSAIVALRGANPGWTGNTVVDAGRISIAANNNLGAASTVLTLNDRTGIVFANSLTLTHPIIVNGDPTFDVATGSTVQIAAPITGAGEFVKTGGGTIQLTSAANSYTGPTTISGGTLSAGATGAFSSGSAFVVNAGTLDLAGYSNSIASLAGNGIVQNSGGAATLTTGGSGSATSFSGTIVDGTGPLALTIAGGTQTLSGTNTYSGATTIAAGATLVLAGNGSIAMSSGIADAGTFDISGTNGGATIATLSGAGGATLGARTLMIGNGATTFAGIASGSGGLVVAGGTQTLSGTNTYGGATTIGAGAKLALTGNGSLAMSSGIADAGTFDISGTSGGATIATLSGAGGVTLGARTLVVGAAIGVFSGTLGAANDTGGVTIGGGTQAMSGVATAYSGATTIGAGAVLALANTTNIASSSGIVDNGVFSIAGNGNTSVRALSGSGSAVLGANNLTIAAGTFTGTLGSAGDTGALVKTGAGTFTFAGGAYSGATNVMQGTLVQTGATPNASMISIAPGASLQTGNAFVLASNAVVNDMGTLVLNNHDQTIGTLTGTGIVQLGTATLTYTAANSTFAGSLVGSGGFTKTGSSTFTVSGNNTYSGNTNVDGGIFNVTGSLFGSNVIVNSGGMLSGSGTIVDPTINAGGILAPGMVAGAPTTMMVDVLTFMPGSFYNVMTTPTASDRMVVTGATTINGGTVQVLAGAGTYNPQSRYSIIASAGGVTGTFAGVTSNLAFLTPTLVYDPNDVTLVLSRNDLSFAGVAATANQRAVANGLTVASRNVQSAAGGAILNAIASLSAAQAQAAFDGVSGSGVAAAQSVAHRASALFASTIADQTTFFDPGAGNSVTLTEGARRFLSYAPLGAGGPIVTHDALPAPRTWRTWATGFGAADNVRGDANLGTAAQTSSIYGGTLGVDYQLTPDTLAGLALGGSDGSFSVPGRSTFGTTTGGHVAVFTLANFGAFYGAGTTSASFYGNKTTRNVAGFGGLAGETDRGNFASREFRSRAEFGWHASVFGATLTPFVALDIAQLRSNGFSESALSGPSLLGLDVHGQTSASVPGSVGARIARPTTFGNGLMFTPTLQAAYVHEFAPQRNQVGAFINLPGSTFLVEGARAASNAVQIKAGAELAWNSDLRLFATFDSEISRLEQTYAGKGGLRYIW